MTITLNIAEWNQCQDELLVQATHASVDEAFIKTYKVPEFIGKGNSQSIELYPDTWLAIGHCIYRDEILVKHPEAEHPIQFSFKLAGLSVHSNGEQSSPASTMISGNGIQREIISQVFPDTLTVSLEIFMSPERLAMLFPDVSGQLPSDLKLLLKGSDWQTLIYPKSNSEIQHVVQQIVNCPYQGFAKRLYLQGKVHDLIAVQLASILPAPVGVTSSSRLKPQTIASIHQVKEILLTNLENPPSLLALSQQVGVSHSTLRRGFQELFNTTVFGYLTQQRMIQSEQLLRNGRMTVAEVANQVGYAHLGCFAAAFKRQFGIKPSECITGKKQNS
jgi:AraC-like DNA-binding protein